MVPVLLVCRDFLTCPCRAERFPEYVERRSQGDAVEGETGDGWNPRRRHEVIRSGLLGAAREIGAVDTRGARKMSARSRLLGDGGED
jgi:hypothetical protein